ncbi:MAG TPA: hypothetical protein VEL05_01545 [Candidatus Acidoferrum sp.]|nr:hypothetical protein [Candidatus Acidoferrum sp.]
MGKKSRNRRVAAAVEQPRGGANRAAGGHAPHAHRPEPLAASSSGAIAVYIGVPFGLALLILGLAGGLRADPLPSPLVIALCLAGALEAVLCWRTLYRSRVAWSFAVALSGTLTMAFLFGSPKVRDTIAVPIGVAVVPALVALLVTCLLAAAASEISSRLSQ